MSFSLPREESSKKDPNESMGKISGPPLPKNVACEICSIQVSKYKCPKCFIRYCSVICFKKHKENFPCEEYKKNDKEEKEEEEEEKEEKEEKEEEAIHTKFIYESSGKHLLSKVGLERLNCDNLRNLLKNSNLQKTLLHINSRATGEGKQKALEMAITNNEEFANFINIMLKEVTVRDEEGNFDIV